MAICPKCGSPRVEFKREDAGFRRTSHGSRREHRTVGFCKSCGYTWITDGPKFDEKKTTTFLGKILRVIFGFCVIMVIVMFIQGRINDLHKTTRTIDYEVNASNVVLVSNPTEQYIVDTLKKIDGVIEIEPATEDHDPNSLLGKEGGASSVVFFSYNKIDQDSISGNNVIDKGTDAGGCIEVFKTEKDAKDREKHLAIFGVSGSHVTIGTTIVRTSYKLSYEDQDELESQICKALLGY